MKAMDLSHGEDHLYGGGFHSDLLRSTGKKGQKPSPKRGWLWTGLRLVFAN